MCDTKKLLIKCIQKIELKYVYFLVVLALEIL